MAFHSAPSANSSFGKWVRQPTMQYLSCILKIVLDAFIVSLFLLLCRNVSHLLHVLCLLNCWVDPQGWLLKTCAELLFSCQITQLSFAYVLLNVFGMHLCRYVVHTEIVVHTEYCSVPLRIFDRRLHYHVVSRLHGCRLWRCRKLYCIDAYFRGWTVCWQRDWHNRLVTVLFYDG